MIQHGAGEDTIRKQIMKLLQETDMPLTAEEISLNLGHELTPSQVYDHLRHIAKTIRRTSGGKLVLVMRPPICRKCGYVFKEIKKPRAPSKCPKCHSQWIDPPAFMITES